MTGYYTMQSSREQQNFYQNSRVGDQPAAHEFESHLQYPCGTLENQLFSDDGSQQMQFPEKPSQSYRTLTAAMPTGGGHLGNSSSTVSYSSDSSPMSHTDSQRHPLVPGNDINKLQFSETTYSCEFINLKKKIKEIETILLGPEPDITMSNEILMYGGPSDISPGEEFLKQTMTVISDSDLKEFLVKCAKAVADNDRSSADWLMSELGHMVSVTGSPVQRLGAYMREGLVARIYSSKNPIYKTLRCKEPTCSELLSYLHLLHEVCPYFKFGYMSANGAIAEAMKAESRIHIIDLQIAEGGHWFTLIQAFAARPGGPPRIRITGVDDATSAFVMGGGLDIVGERLSNLAKSCRVPFEFNAATISDSELDFKKLKILPGEALAVNFAFMLHHLPDEGVDTINQQERILRSVKSLFPKVVTLVEKEANTNTFFIPRFLETFRYYMAVFESIDITLPRDNKERIAVEQHCLGREIVNIIACEGTDRVERHELLEKWRSRFVAAGFEQFPLSSSVNATIKNLLKKYCQHYTLEEREGALYLGWMKQKLVASCAWR